MSLVHHHGKNVQYCHYGENMTLKQESRTRVNENGRVVIPAAFRKAMGIRVGDEVVLRMEDNELRILTLKRRIEQAQRLVRQHMKPGSSLVDELIAERRQAAKRE
jgi:AbrB family looped-hinge helix DNA binding protein